MNHYQSHFLTAVGAFGLGALAMYIFDPQQGRRRRAMARDQLVHAQRRIGDSATSTYHELRNRAYGIYAQTRSMAGQPLEHQDEQAQLQPESVHHLGR